MERPQHWLSKVEKIFTVMGFYEEHKVTYATCMLSGEAKDWWKFASQALPSNEEVIPWAAFKESFLGNYFPRDLRKLKAKEFMELKQESMTVGEYDSKFHELMKY